MRVGLLLELIALHYSLHLSALVIGGHDEGPDERHRSNPTKFKIAPIVVSHVWNTLASPDCVE